MLSYNKKGVEENMIERLMGRVLNSLALIGSIVLLWGCGQDKVSQEAGTASLHDGTASNTGSNTGGMQKGRFESLQGRKITFLTSQNKYCDEYSLMAAAVREIYGCDVEFQVVPDNEYASFLRLKLATTEVPDVFEYNCPSQNQEIQASLNCVDLSQEPWVSRLVNPDIVKDPDNGNIYAMPKESAAGFMAVYYNKRVLNNCGITDPHPKTYLEFLNILEAVKEKGEGVIPFYETNADVWTTQIFMTGGYPAALNNRAEDTFGKLLKNEVKWTEVPEFTNILTLYQNLMKDGYVNKDQASAGYKSAVEMLGTGKAAMYLTTELCASEVASKYPSCELGAFVIPYADRDVLPISKSVTGLFIPIEGVQTEISKLFLEVWSLPEIQNIYFFRQRSFTAFTDTKGGKILDCLQMLMDEYVLTGKYIYQMNDQMPDNNLIFEELWKEYSLVASGDITPKTALENFQHIYEDYLEKQGGMK
jgi:raffinose/stachyose/melibiose transport system substrate-binding protein